MASSFLLHLARFHLQQSRLTRDLTTKSCLPQSPTYSLKTSLAGCLLSNVRNRLVICSIINSTNNSSTTYLLSSTIFFWLHFILYRMQCLKAPGNFYMIDWVCIPNTIICNKFRKLIMVNKITILFYILL